jgi:hypothetical protein
MAKGKKEKKAKNAWKAGFMGRMFFFGAIHFMVTLGLIVYANKGSVVFFTSQDPTIVGTQKMVGTITWLLSQPAYNFWNMGLLNAVPYYMSWGFFAVNSIFWGFLLAFFFGMLFKTKKKKTA